jgi:NAD(P)-dependent dehydrogenase (short-subunit alcohol dehydrogenase family)
LQQRKQAIVFDRVFFPGVPKDWPQITKEAIMAKTNSGQGQQFLEQLEKTADAKDEKGNPLRIGALRPGPFREVVDANLHSAVFAIDAMLPFMRQAGGGRIVLVSSTAGLSASPTAALSYSLSKAGLAALPRLLAPELATINVLINAVAPGKFDNPNWPDDPEQVKRYKQGVPLGRLASVEEVAALIVFLASAANGYITGQTIVQDGGRLASAG